jgi:hypothetical protein
MRKLTLFFLFIFEFTSNSQILYHQDTFHGGVTCVGFSSGLGYGEGYVNVYIEPGSTIKRAYLISYHAGNDSVQPISINDQVFQFDSLDVVTSVMHDNSAFSPIRILVKDITSFVASNLMLSYLLKVPDYNSGFPGNWGTWCPILYIEYENSSLPLINTALWLNDKNLDGLEFYEMSNLNPINNTFQASLSIYMDRACSGQDDASRVWLNGDQFGLTGDSLGMVWGLDASSINGCNGAKGHFYYQNNALFGLDDDSPDDMMNQFDALADISAYIVNGATSYNLTLRHNQFPGGIGNKNVNLIFVNAYTTTCDTFSVSLLAEDTTICKGDSLQFFASGADSYEWSPSIGLSCDDCPNPKISPQQSTTYFLTSTKYGNCKKTQPIKIRVNENPLLNSFTLTTDTCGENSGAISNINASGVAPLTFGLNGNSTSSFSNLQSGWYNVSVTDANGCKDDSLVFIESVIAAEANFSATPEIGYVPLDVDLFDQSRFANNLIWYINGDTINSQNPTYIFDSIGIYTISQIAYNTNFWCADTAYGTIKVFNPITIFIPNIITANNDGINDDFTIQLEGGRYIWWQVYNRWGNLVYENEEYISTNQSTYDLWDGVDFNFDQPVTDGVYFYQIIVKSPVGDSEVYTGSLTVVGQ